MHSGDFRQNFPIETLSPILGQSRKILLFSFFEFIVGLWYSPKGNFYHFHFLLVHCWLIISPEGNFSHFHFLLVHCWLCTSCQLVPSQLNAELNFLDYHRSECCQIFDWLLRTFQLGRHNWICFVSSQKVSIARISNSLKIYFGFRLVQASRGGWGAGWKVPGAKEDLKVFWLKIVF